jgi:hypothetical protein
MELHSSGTGDTVANTRASPGEGLRCVREGVMLVLEDKLALRRGNSVCVRSPAACRCLAHLGSNADNGRADENKVTYGVFSGRR